MSKIVNVDVDDKTHTGLATIGQHEQRSMRFVARDILCKGVEAKMRKAGLNAPELIRKHRKP